jgi:hypothetical protein
MTRYRGCEFSATGTTTDITRQVFGRSYQAIGYVWEVSGRQRKNACQRPCLTSASACREWIRECDELEADQVEYDRRDCKKYGDTPEAAE